MKLPMPIQSLHWLLLAIKAFSISRLRRTCRHLYPEIRLVLSSSKNPTLSSCNGQCIQELTMSSLATLHVSRSTSTESIFNSLLILWPEWLRGAGHAHMPGPTQILSSVWMRAVLEKYFLTAPAYCLHGEIIYFFSLSSQSNSLVW